MLHLRRWIDSVEFRGTYIVWIQKACIAAAMVRVARIVQHHLGVVHRRVIVHVVV